ncbi:MAG: Rad3-related DNA helicase, partial [Gammaproteobacteria bacterium]
ARSKPKKRGRKRPGSTPLERLGREVLPGTPFHETLDRAREELLLTADALDDLDREVRELDEWRARAQRERGERETHTLLRDYMALPEALPLIDARQRLSAGCSDLDATLSEIAERVDATPIRSARSVRRSMDLARADLIGLSNEIQAWLPLSDGRPSYRPETFYDVEKDIRGRRTLVARVLLPAEYLGRNYYPGLKSAIFISATTWLQGGFDSALAYLGLDRAAAPDPEEVRDGCTVRTFRAPEVFDYGRVLVLIPRDAPSVARRKEDFLRYVRNFVGWLGERTRGRMLVLFTNASDTRETGLALEGFFRPRRIPLYYQGMRGAEKEELAERFRSRVDSILLGVDTFWYGADFPGPTLEYLVLVKLPYGVPDLYHHAQCSALGQSEQRKRIYQPRALAKFRQGFGRLLRTTSDSGCVFVLDDRILDPRHRSFLRELPLTSPGPFGSGGHATTARLARGDTDMCAREAFEHMELTESIRRRGLSASFAESFGGMPAAHGEPGVLRPFARDEPAPAKPWQESPAVIDIPIDELPF